MNDTDQRDGTGEIDSPCNRICTLDSDEVCLGCQRTLAEIVSWHDMDDAARRAVLASVAVRRAERVARGLPLFGPGGQWLDR